MTKSRWTAVAAAVVSLVLSACGGGGGDDTSAASPSSSSSATASTSSSASSSGATSAGAWWRPAVGDTWQWQLQGTIDTAYAVKVYDIDLFEAPQATIAALKSAGRHVVCYFSAGSSENWRPDYAQFQAPDMGNALSGWAGERWLDTRSANVRAVMKARLDLAVSKGCDGVEPDNVDGYANNTGFALTTATQLDYNRFLAAEAHGRNLAVALKNDVDQLSDLVASFDFALNEQCHQYSECDGYSVFIAAGKPVFNAEYQSDYRTDSAARSALCDDARARNFRTLVLPQALDDSFRYSCDS